MGNENNQVKDCNKKCRKYYGCELEYSVNEQILLCRGLFVDLDYGTKYFLGSTFENPWYLYVEEGLEID